MVQTSKEVLLEKVKEVQGRVGEAEQPMVVVLKKGIQQTGETGKIFVSNDVRDQVMREFYDSPLVGHPGIQKTIDLVGRYFWWQIMYKDI